MPHLNNNTDDYQVDIYLDCDNGIFRLCKVGMLEQKYKAQIAQISGFKINDKYNGYVPHLVI